MDAVRVHPAPYCATPYRPQPDHGVDLGRVHRCGLNQNDTFGVVRPPPVLGARADHKQPRVKAGSPHVIYLDCLQQPGRLAGLQRPEPHWSRRVVRHGARPRRLARRERRFARRGAGHQTMRPSAGTLPPCPCRREAGPAVSQQRGRGNKDGRPPDHVPSPDRTAPHRRTRAARAGAWGGVRGTARPEPRGWPRSGAQQTDARSYSFWVTADLEDEVPQQPGSCTQHTRNQHGDFQCKRDFAAAVPGASRCMCAVDIDPHADARVFVAE